MDSSPERHVPAALFGGLFSRKRLTSPSSVLIGTTVASYVIRLASTVVLTRLLTPEAFGVIAMILSIFFIIAMITDVGFEAYVVRHERGDDPHFLDAIWTIHAGRGLLIAVTCAVLAIPLAWVLDKPQLAPLLAVSGISLGIDGFASLSLLTALRRGLVRRLSFLELVAQIVQLSVAIFLAYWWRNAWALVAGMLASSSLRTVASYLVFPDSRRRPKLDRPIAGDLWRFSRVIAASSALTLVISQVDKLVLARVFTLKQFGIYAIAANLAAAVSAIALRYVQRIVYPALAATWRAEPEAMKQRYYELRGLLFYAYLFGGGVLIGSAPLVVRILYDPRYAFAGIYLRLLAITATLVIVTTSANEALVAMGRTSTTLITNVIRIFWLVPVGIGAFLVAGPIGLIVALSLIELPAYVYTSWVLNKHELFSPAKEMRSWSLIMAGVGVGFAADALGKLILPL